MTGIVNKVAGSGPYGLLPPRSSMGTQALRLGRAHHHPA